MAGILLGEGGIVNDNSGALVGAINADTSAAVIANAKVAGLANLGAEAFSAYPLTYEDIGSVQAGGPNLVLNGDFSQIHGNAIVFYDSLCIASPWTVVSGSFTFAQTVANPTSAPTLTAESGSTALSAGQYTVAYTWTNVFGQTEISPTAQVTLTAGQQVQVAALTLPDGVTGVDYYMSTAAGGSTLGFVASGTGAEIDLTAAGDATAPPSANSAQLGATCTANGALTGGVAAWVPMAYSSGTGEALLYVHTTFTTSAAAPQNLAVFLWQDGENQYWAQWQAAGSFVLGETVANTSTNLDSATPTADQAASTTYTIYLQIGTSGALAATLYAGNGTGGTLLATATATNADLAGPFQVGLSCSEDVVLTNCLVAAPAADGWQGPHEEETLNQWGSGAVALIAGGAPNGGNAQQWTAFQQQGYVYFGGAGSAYDYITVNEGQEYTMSFLARYVGSTATKLDAFMTQGNAENTIATEIFTLTDSWAWYSITGTAPADSTDIIPYLTITNAPASAQIACVKIEAGGTASAWEPMGGGMQDRPIDFYDYAGAVGNLTTVSVPVLYMGTSRSYYLQSDGTVYPMGIVLPNAGSITNVAGATITTGSTDDGSWVLTPAGASNVALYVKGLSSQTANLQVWLNSSGTVLASVNPSGLLTTNAGVTANTTALGGNTTELILAENTTAATSSAAQNTPAINWAGSAWNTGSSESLAADWRAYGQSISGSSPSSTFHLQAAVNGAGYADALTLTSAGLLKAVGALESKNNTLDDGSGNATIAGTLLVDGAATFSGFITANAGYMDYGALGAARSGVQSSSTDAALAFNNTGTGGRNYWWDSGSSGAGVGEGNFAIYDQTAAAVRLYVDSSGNLHLNEGLDVDGYATLTSGAHISDGVWVDGIPSGSDGQGSYIGWNVSDGTGEMDLLNNQGEGSGGWQFRYWTDGAWSSPVAEVLENGQIVSNATTGTAPLEVSSTTQVANLNAEYAEYRSTDSSYLATSYTSGVGYTGAGGTGSYNVAGVGSCKIALVWSINNDPQIVGIVTTYGSVYFNGSSVTIGSDSIDSGYLSVSKSGYLYQSNVDYLWLSLG